MEKNTGKSQRKFVSPEKWEHSAYRPRVLLVHESPAVIRGLVREETELMETKPPSPPSPPPTPGSNNSDVTFCSNMKNWDLSVLRELKRQQFFFYPEIMADTAQG